MTAGSRRMWQNAAAMVVLAVFQRGMGLIAIFLLARILDVQGLGAYAFTQSTSQTFFGLVRLGADAGLHVSVAKLYPVETKPQAEVLLGEALVLFLAIAAVAAGSLLLLADSIAARLFAAPELAPFVAASAVLLAAQVVSQYCYTIFAGLHAFVAYARLTWATSLLTLALTVAAATAFGVVGAVWAAAAGSTITALLLAVWLYCALVERGIALRPRIPSKPTLTLLALGFPFYLSGLLIIPADFLCVGYLSRINGVDALGELRVVQSLMSMAMVLPSALSGPLVSHLSSRLGDSNGADVVVIQMRAIWVLSLAVTIGLATLWPVLVDTIFGSHFTVARSAGVLALLAFTPMMLGSVLTGAFLASRRSGMLLAIGILQVLGIAASAKPLITAYGLGGYLSVQASYWSIGAIAAMALLGRQFERPIFRLWMLPLGLLTVAISALIVVNLAVDESFATRLTIGAGMTALLALTCAKLVFSVEERAIITTALGSALRHVRARARSTSATGNEPQ